MIQKADEDGGCYVPMLKNGTSHNFESVAPKFSLWEEAAVNWRPVKLDAAQKGSIA